MKPVFDPWVSGLPLPKSDPIRDLTNEIWDLETVVEALRTQVIELSKAIVRLQNLK